MTAQKCKINAHCKYSCIYICCFKENANHLMPVFQHSKLEVWSRILFFSFAIVRCRNCNIESSTFLDVMYSHWEQCREVIEESVVCELLQTKFFLYGKIKCVEKVVVFYIFLDNVKNLQCKNDCSKV